MTPNAHEKLNTRRNDHVRFSTGIPALVFGAWLLFAVSVTPVVSEEVCPEKERTVTVGFYTDFRPISYSASRDPDQPGFHDHRGYEADLLTAMETVDGGNLSFHRRGVAVWDGIWLLPTRPDYDLVGGGIAALASRTHDAVGRKVITFTDGHIRFRQSLLVRTEDAGRLSRYEDLDGAVRVGVLAGTTGEARLLELTGMTDSYGILSDGIRIDTPRGMVVSGGGVDYRIAADGSSQALEDRRRLRPASPAMPQVLYMEDEAMLIGALLAGRIDALAQAEIGNRHAAAEHDGMLAVVTLDTHAETGAFALHADDTALAACLDRLIARLTDNGRIGYRDWLEDPAVFLDRAR